MGRGVELRTEEGMDVGRASAARDEGEGGEGGWRGVGEVREEVGRECVADVSERSSTRERLGLMK